jgi:hypothetical protein
MRNRYAATCYKCGCNVQEIVEHWACCGNASSSMIAISEVLDGDD